MNGAATAADETIGEHILRCRKLLGMSRAGLSRRSGVDRGSISRIERGAEKGIPGVRTLIPIFAALYGKRIIVADLKEPGQRVRLLRQVYLLTCIEFAVLIGAHKQLVSNWECGAALPSLAAIRRICRTFSLGLNFFFWTDGANELIAKRQRQAVAMRNLGERIRRLCADRGLSMYRVSKLAGLHPNHVGQIVIGRYKPYGWVLARIAEVLGSGTLTSDRVRFEAELARVCHRTGHPLSPREARA